MQGPLAHPVRPDSYIEISNFYTATVYNKGAELIRMLHTMLGPEKFRAGTDLYFERHDGEAATCDDFVKALEDASGVDLSRVPDLVLRRPARRGSARGSSMTPRRGPRRCTSRSRSPPTPGPAGQAADADPAQDRADRRATAATRLRPSG